MTVWLSTPRTRRNLLSRNITIFMFLVLSLVRAKGLGKFKKTTSSVIKPATFRFVA
jgi:hypothetical protein